MDLNGSLTPPQVWRPELDADKKSRTLQKEQAKSNAGIHDEHLDKLSVARHSLADRLCRPQQSGTNHHEHHFRQMMTRWEENSFLSTRIIYWNVFQCIFWGIGEVPCQGTSQV